MAFKKTILTKQGFKATDAYHRVENVRLYTKDSMLFQLRSYKDDSGVPFFADIDFSIVYDLNGANPIAQAYAHLKTLPDFADAEDC